MVLWAKAGDFQLGTSFHSWALRVAHFEILAHLNRKQRDHRVFSAELLDIFARELDDESVDPLSAVRQSLRTCLEDLETGDRELIEQHYFKGVAVKQLADELGRRLTSVYRSINRIRNRLLQCIERQAEETD
jgi:RNA polymerase sigma-70 factor (ECF subfamily)